MIRINKIISGELTIEEAVDKHYDDVCKMVMKLEPRDLYVGYEVLDCNGVKIAVEKKDIDDEKVKEEVERIWGVK